MYLKFRFKVHTWMKKIRAIIVIRSRERLLWLFKDDLSFVINCMNNGTDDGSVKFAGKWEPTLWVVVVVAAASKALDVGSIFVMLFCSCDPSEDCPVVTSLSKFISPFWPTATAEPLSETLKCCMKPRRNFKYFEDTEILKTKPCFSRFFSFNTSCAWNIIHSQMDILQKKACTSSKTKCCIIKTTAQTQEYHVHPCRISITTFFNCWLYDFACNCSSSWNQRNFEFMTMTIENKYKRNSNYV